MRLIITHEQPDFDALASLALAKLLYPGSTITTQGALNPQLRAFLSLYRDELQLTPLNNIELNQVKELIVVDTTDPTRIQPFKTLIGRVPITLYDHHPTPTNPIPAARGITEQVGATATLLTREITAKAITIPPPVATLALLAIHEDTGNLTFNNTTPHDYTAAAHLLKSGANLEVVRRFAHTHLTQEQLTFRDALHQHTETTTISGRPVATAAFNHPTYVPAASVLINDLLDTHRVDAAIAAVGMQNATLVFARSNDRFDCAATLKEAIGGGGHPGAAFGRTNHTPENAIRLTLNALSRHAAPTITAQDLMSHPVKTARDTDTVTAATEKLNLYGHNGMPVLNADGQLVGVVSRRDLDRARRHGLGANPVTGYMSQNVITASPTTTLRQLEELVLRHNIGRIPITQDGQLKGIVTRTDLITARHHTPHGDTTTDLLNRLPATQQAALKTAARLAGNDSLYLVGGTVRDLLLATSINDLDLVTEGDATLLGAKLQRELGGTLSAHVEFGTATLTLENGLELDLASAREETYAHPAALPDVVPSSIRKDIARRDYTINAMALRLNPPPTTLLDPYNGESDLEAKLLRVLHPLSYLEDPTRILRGARLAGRLGFKFEPTTKQRARAALTKSQLQELSSSRSRAELELTLAEPRVTPALKVLTELGALTAIFGLPEDHPRNSTTPTREQLTQALDARRATTQIENDAYLLALLITAPDDAAEAHIKRFNWPRKQLQLRAKLRELIGRHNAGSAGAPILDEELTSLPPAALSLLRAVSRELSTLIDRAKSGTTQPKLTGSDVLALGLPPGPNVGRILRKVAEARAEGQTNSYEEEVELARTLINNLAEREEPE